MRKKISSAKEADLTHVLVVGDAESRTPVIEHVKKRSLSLWSARSPETAINSFNRGLRVAMVVIAMTSIEEGCAFATWVGVNHPNATVVFVNENIEEFGPEARAAGARYLVPNAVLARELPRILAYHLDEPAR